jgi:hypothetical protein
MLTEQELEKLKLESKEAIIQAEKAQIKKMDGAATEQFEKKF